MAGGFQGVHLELQSTIDELDHVQIVTEDIARQLGLDEETLHWTCMAVRESVINAIVHGNKGDSAKHVFVDFGVIPGPDRSDLIVRVRDQGQGFDPSHLDNPLAPGNVLKTGGRGIFLIRHFMDEVSIQPAREGGMEVRMVKHL
jgi:serine/threonine-protein kinase RsbW